MNSKLIDAWKDLEESDHSLKIRGLNLLRFLNTFEIPQSTPKIYVDLDVDRIRFEWFSKVAMLAINISLEENRWFFTQVNKRHGSASFKNIMERQPVLEFLNVSA